MLQNILFIFADMKRIIATFAALAALIPAFSQEVWEISPKDYEISNSDLRKAKEIIKSNPGKTLVFPNPSEGAQWFPEASLGLFMHWGIHSVAGAQPSWAMIKGYRWNGGYRTRKEYYDWAKEFRPGEHPFEYLKAASEAGFKYAVLTSRHHDGYALWPSKYGIGTKQYLGGRDLVKEYVEACREAGLRVGLYYSPRDWHYPGAMPDEEFDVATRGQKRVLPKDNDEQYARFLGYVMAQIEELLTNYGKIDVLWLDGMGWDGIEDQHTEAIYSWIRSLQPDIVVNDRWSNVTNPDDPNGNGYRVGDFTTPFEGLKPTYSPSKWFDHCHIWTHGGGGWGFDKTGSFRPMSWFMEEFVASRSFGGNFLINAGPDKDGRMMPGFYSKLDSLKTWLAHSGESLMGAEVTPGVRFSNVPLTSRGKDIWYAHLERGFKGQASVLTGRQPKSVKCLRTGKDIMYAYRSGVLTFTLSDKDRSFTDDVVKIEF